MDLVISFNSRSIFKFGVMLFTTFLDDVRPIAVVENSNTWKEKKED